MYLFDFNYREQLYIKFRFRGLPNFLHKIKLSLNKKKKNSKRKRREKKYNLIKFSSSKLFQLKSIQLETEIV